MCVVAVSAAVPAVSLTGTVISRQAAGRTRDPGRAAAQQHQLAVLAGSSWSNAITFVAGFVTDGGSQHLYNDGLGRKQPTSTRSSVLTTLVGPTTYGVMFQLIPAS